MLKFFRIDKKTLKELIIIAVPMVVSQGAFALMIFTDRYFLSMISPTHIAAALGGGVAYFCCIAFFMGVFSYTNALVAQYYGAGDLSKCTRSATQSFILCLFSVPVLLVIAFGAGNIFELMGHEHTQAALEKSYFYILMWGAPVALLKICIASYFSGIGRTTVVMVVDIIAVIVNIPLTYVLIFGKLGLPEMGIVGAGLGTLISLVLALCLFCFFYFHHQHSGQFHVASSFVLDKEILKRHLRLGLPCGVEIFLNVAAFNLFLLMFQSYGVVEGASAGIVFNWDILSFVPMMGMSIAITSLVGRFIGSQNMDKVNSTVASAFLLGLGYSGILSVVFIVFRESLVDVFIIAGPDYQPIHDLSSYMMVGLATYMMADAGILIAGGVLKGAGDTQWLMKMSVALHWLMLLAQFVVIKVLDLGARVSWLVFVIMILLLSVVCLLRLYGQKWRHPDALKQMLAH